MWFILLLLVVLNGILIVSLNYKNLYFSKVVALATSVTIFYLSLYLYYFLFLAPIIGILIVSEKYNNSKQTKWAIPANIVYSKTGYLLLIMDLSFILIVIGLLLKINLGPLKNFYSIILFLFIMFSIYSISKICRTDSIPSVKDIFVLFVRIGVIIYVVNINIGQLIFFLWGHSLFIALYFFEVLSI
jgi:hypothetical protein